jgi:hypothetical protein
MINFRMAVVSALIIAFTSMGARGFMGVAQSKSDRSPDPPDASDGLQLSVELKDTVVRLNGTTQIIVRLNNVGDKPIATYKNLVWAEATSLSLFVKVIHGKLKDPTSVKEFPYIPPFPKEDFITIQPGESIEKKRLITMEEIGIKEPGDYRIIVRYRSPIPEDFAPAGLELWAMENGPLQTKPIDLKVTR